MTVTPVNVNHDFGVAANELAERLTEVGSTAHAADLRLAMAALRGHPRALVELEANFFPAAARAAARVLGRSAADDLAQYLRAKLLVADAGAVPKLAEYSGRGPLAGWLRVVAVRAALDERRRANPAEPRDLVDDATFETLLPGSDPELRHLRERYAPEFAVAVRAAVRALTKKQRTLLRLHVLDGLSIDQLGAVHGVHRATVARWIASAREELQRETERLLLERLRITPSELKSLAALVRSQLDVSLAGLLKEVGAHE